VRSGSVSSRPHQVERVALGAALRVLDPNHRHSAIPWIANQRLTAAAVNSGETEVDRVKRHSSRALESAPLRRLSREISQIRGVATDFYFSDTVDRHFNRALTLI